MMIGREIEDIDIRMPIDAYDIGKDTPTFNAYLTAVVRNSDGRVIRVHRQRSHSPTANFIGLMLPLSYFNTANNSFTLTTTGGSTYSYKPGIGTTVKCISYPNTANNYYSYLVMIQVGSGTQSNPFNANSLAAPIANGSGTGQLIYGSVSVPSNITVSGNEAYFTISQAFNNSSGATVTITEVGIIIYLQTAASAAGNTNIGQLLVWYDVLSSAISVPNGGSVVIYYTFMVNP